jgi:hypothetical protein
MTGRESVLVMRYDDLRALAFDQRQLFELVKSLQKPTWPKKFDAQCPHPVSSAMNSISDCLAPSNVYPHPLNSTNSAMGFWREFKQGLRQGYRQAHNEAYNNAIPLCAGCRAITLTPST